MDLSRWFDTQLATSADGFIWAVEQVPAERLYAPPPGPEGGLGEWVTARHAFHLLYYERKAALPAMQYWLGKPGPSFDDYDEDGAWESAPDLRTILREFRNVRAEQTALLPRIDETLWHEARDTGWGNVTLRWIVSKTYQHTAEHINDVLRIALFWDFIADYNIRRQEEESRGDATA
jgi:hypothetical protein